MPYVNGYYTVQGRFSTDDVTTGEIISLVCSTAGAAYYPTSVTIDDDYTYPIESLVLPVPHFEGKDSNIVQQGAGMVIAKSDEKTEYACSIFLKWFTETERNTEFAAKSSYLPVKKDANDVNKVLEYFDTEQTNDILKNSIKTSIEQISSNHLFTSKLVKNYADIREFFETYIQDSADEAHDEVFDRINNGEKRDSVIDEYTNDEAFEKWFADFEKTLTKIASQD